MPPFSFATRGGSVASSAADATAGAGFKTWEER
jgi:hypothetical protein